MLKRPIKLYLLTVVMCSAMAQEGAAQVAVWDAGGGADTNWDTYTNWDGDADPGLVEAQLCRFSQRQRLHPDSHKKTLRARRQKP